MGDRPSGSWLKPMLKALSPQFREVAFLSLFINLLALALPVFILQVYDRVVFYSGLTTLQGLVIGMVVVIAFDFLLRQGRSRLMQRVGLRIDVEVGRRLNAKLTALPLRTLETRPANYWQTLFRDIEQVRNLVSGPTAVLLFDLPFVPLFIGLIFVIAAPIVWVLVLALLAFVVLAWWSSYAVQGASRAERTASLGRDGLISEMIAGRTTIKALALDAAMLPLWEDRHGGTIERSLVRGSRADTFGNAGLGLMVLTTVALTTVGALAILDQLMTIGALIAANMLSSRIISPLNQLVGAWRNFATYRQSVTRLGEIFGAEEERRESEIVLERPQGVVSLEDIAFRFDDDGPAAIDGVRFTIKPGGLHGIVGPNGSGKTTLLKLMQGLYRPSQGRVLLDGADITQFTRRELAGWFGYVPQECFLFAGTIRDNIAKGWPDAGDEEIVAAARLAGVHDYIVDLPDGYATDIGEAGGRLSAGQRQRIAIARAILGNPPVLLLDEPTSTLDRRAEEELRTTLSQLARERNVVVVTHSPILLSACHNMIALDRGKVVLAGPSHEVMPRLFAEHAHKPPLERKA